MLARFAPMPWRSSTAPCALRPRASQACSTLPDALLNCTVAAPSDAGGAAMTAGAGRAITQPALNVNAASVAARALILPLAHQEPSSIPRHSSMPSDRPWNSYSTTKAGDVPAHRTGFAKSISRTLLVRRLN